jgi:hypothetical protein
MAPGLPARSSVRSRERFPAPPLPETVATPSPPPALPAAAYGALFDNLRALASGDPMRAFVFAGAADDQSAHVVAAGMVSHARHRGLSVVTARLIESAGSVLLCQPADDMTEPIGGGNNSPGIYLHRAGWQGACAEWLQTTAVDADLVIIEGRPLGDSIDSAVLACACDGLVIVAQAEVTAREALRVAVERARTVGCRTLGVVMRGPSKRLPGWLRRT